MMNLTFKFYLALLLFLFLFIAAFLTKEVIQINLIASIALLLFITGIRILSRSAVKKQE